MWAWCGLFLFWVVLGGNGGGGGGATLHEPTTLFVFVGFADALLMLGVVLVCPPLFLRMVVLACPSFSRRCVAHRILFSRSAPPPSANMLTSIDVHHDQQRVHQLVRACAPSLSVGPVRSGPCLDALAHECAGLVVLAAGLRIGAHHVHHIVHVHGHALAQLGHQPLRTVAQVRVKRGQVLAAHGSLANHHAKAVPPTCSRGRGYFFLVGEEEGWWQAMRACERSFFCVCVRAVLMRV